MATELWVEKFRPKSLDEYVWTSQALRAKVDEWLAAEALPNLLFAGSAGTGKTSLAMLMLRLLDIPLGDILYINASRERQVEAIQTKISGFVSTWALGPTGIKYVILDESDRISPTAQGFLRAEMEQYHEICRFILTANYPERLIPAIRSRCQEFFFRTLNEEDFIARVGEVLTREEVDFDVEDLLAYTRIAYPDLRKCIQLVQQHTVGGKLQPPSSEEGTSKDWMVEMVELFKKGRFTEARKMILGQAQTEEYPDVYRFLYRNLNLFGSTEEKQDEALMIIRRGVVNHTLAADAEINLAGTLAELAINARD